MTEQPRDYSEPRGHKPDDWCLCRDCGAVFPVEDAICSSLDAYGDDYDLFCPYCEQDWLEAVEAPDGRTAAFQVAWIFLVIVIICVVAVLVVP